MENHPHHHPLWRGLKNWFYTAPVCRCTGYNGSALNVSVNSIPMAGKPFEHLIDMWRSRTSCCSPKGRAWQHRAALDIQAGKWMAASIKLSLSMHPSSWQPLCNGQRESRTGGTDHKCAGNAHPARGSDIKVQFYCKKLDDIKGNCVDLSLNKSKNKSSAWRVWRIGNQQPNRWCESHLRALTRWWCCNVFKQAQHWRRRKVQRNSKLHNCYLNRRHHRHTHCER